MVNSLKKKCMSPLKRRVLLNIAERRHLRNLRHNRKKKSGGGYQEYDKFLIKGHLTILENDYILSKVSEIENAEKPIISFNYVSGITIHAAIYLKAFYDYQVIMKNPPSIACCSGNSKVRKILQYIKIKNYGLPIDQEDILCWSINCWDLNRETPQFGRILMVDIFPKFLTNIIPSENFSDIASALQEILTNCVEHAYDKGIFKKYYLFAGKYPTSGNFTFCVFDRGIGFKESLKRQPLKFSQLLMNASDSELIRAAVRGQSGAGSKADGRGRGLESVLEKVKAMDGQFHIYSGNGYYSYRNHKEITKDRPVYLDGAFLAMHIPISDNNSDNCS